MKTPANPKKALPSELAHKKKAAKDIEGKKKVKITSPVAEDHHSEKPQKKKTQHSNGNMEVEESKTKHNQSKPKANGNASETSGRKAAPKKLHMTLTYIQERIKELEKHVDELTGPSNANKRKRVYQSIVKLKAALKNPEEHTVDPVKEHERLQQKKEKVMQKKLEKKKRQEHEQEAERQKMKKKICMVCKQKGHIAEQCRQKPEEAALGSICFNCGSTAHSLNSCPKERIPGQLPFATCFYCNKQGHIGRDCQDNSQGIYYKGGGCFICGSTRHLAKECDQRYASTETRFVEGGGEPNESKQKDPSQKLKSAQKAATKAGKIGEEEEEDMEEELDEDEIADDDDEVDYEDGVADGDYEDESD